MNNHLTWGRGRWLCYAANAERRRRESKELERRPEARPLVGRGVGPELPKIFEMGDAPGGKFPYIFGKREK